MAREMNIWKTMTGRKVEFFDEIKKAMSEGYIDVHVGCDSQQHELETEFVEVVILLKPSKGGRVLYRSESVPRVKSLRERLLMEVQKSVDVAFQLNAVLPEEIELAVHVDANPNTKFKSSNVLPQLVGYVMGQGFTCLTKPKSWAAMHVADFCVKHKHERNTK